MPRPAQGRERCREMTIPLDRPITAEDCRTRAPWMPSAEYQATEAAFFAPVIGKMLEIMDRHGLLFKAEKEGKS